MAELNFPFGAADSQSITHSGGVAAATINNNMTIVDLGTMDADVTLNLTLNKDLNAGAILVVKGASDGTARDVTFGTGITGPDLAGVISKTKTQSFIFDGSGFIGIAAAVQLD